MTALAALVVAHVFDDSKYGNVDFFKHGNAFVGVCGSERLRCGHNDGAIEWCFFAES